MANRSGFDGAYLPPGPYTSSDPVCLYDHQVEAGLRSADTGQINSTLPSFNQFCVNSGQSLAEEISPVRQREELLMGPNAEAPIPRDCSNPFVYELCPVKFSGAPELSQHLKDQQVKKTESAPHAPNRLRPITPVSSKMANRGASQSLARTKARGTDRRDKEKVQFDELERLLKQLGEPMTTCNKLFITKEEKLEALIKSLHKQQPKTRECELGVRKYRHRMERLQRQFDRRLSRRGSDSTNDTARDEISEDEEDHKTPDSSRTVSPSSTSAQIPEQHSQH